MKWVNLTDFTDCGGAVGKKPATTYRLTNTQPQHSTLPYFIEKRIRHKTCIESKMIQLVLFER
jgi:hypothetical protein